MSARAPINRPKKYPYASLVISNEAPRLFILKTDAARLHNERKLQKIEGESAYCARRTWRDIAHDRFPSLHPDVLACASLNPATRSEQGTT